MLNRLYFTSHRTISAAELPHRTIAIGTTRRLIMLNAVLRFIERAMAPGAQMLAKMPPSAIRQVIFSL
jgi:hypothetical protein